MFSRIRSMTIKGISPVLINIETDLTNGLHSFNIVGLPDKSVEEAKDRISAAIKNSGFKSPKQKNQKVVISLAPADVPKEGASFDRGMAIAYLIASKDIYTDSIDDCIFLGELALDGTLRPIKGVLPIVMKCLELGYKNIFVPKENANEGALIKNIKIFGAENLIDVIKHISKEINFADGTSISGCQMKTTTNTAEDSTPQDNDNCIDIRDIKGHETAKRALEIAAVGGHNIMLYGPPGTGKTMLAKAFWGIIPDLEHTQSIEVTSIQSINGKLIKSPIKRPPFRSPHHTASYVSIVGGGSNPKPGEITLAHRGILFLDELPEFDRMVIESLREPMEERSITISRAKGTYVFPADCIVVTAMNLCPCGNKGKLNKKCSCSEKNIKNYHRSISGPIADRIDIWIEISDISNKTLFGNQTSTENSLQIRNRISPIRGVCRNRFPDINKNSDMTANMIGKLKIDNEALIALERASEKFSFSNRALHRIIKIARTISDINIKENIDLPSMLEALQYRPKEDIFI